MSRIVNSTAANVLARVMIPFVEKDVNAKYIRNVFERLNIANISTVDIQPIQNNPEYNRVVMQVDEWYDNECAYNLINRIKSSTHEARIMHNEPNWWVLREKPNKNKKEKKHIKKQKKMEDKIWKRAQKELMRYHKDSIVEDYIQKKISEYKKAQQEEEYDWNELSSLINIELSMS